MKKQLSPLEALENIRKLFIGSPIDLSQQLGIIETALKDYEKKTKLAKEYADINNVAKRLKALEIIKPCCLVADYKTDDPDFRYELAFCKKICLTQEEYDLLREVLYE